MSALYNLVANQQYQVAITHIQSLADGDAVDQLFHEDKFGQTVVHASYYEAPLELYQLMITKAKLDSRKRCLLSITNQWGVLALHLAARWHSDPAVLEFLIREHPLALCATDFWGETPLQRAIVGNRPAAITSLLTDATATLTAGDYAALSFLVHSSTFALRCLASPSYAARIAVRTSLLLCLKTAHPDVPVTYTEPLDLSLAHVCLCKDVWSVILEFV